MPDRYQIVHTLTEAQVEDLIRLYGFWWWTKDRTPADIRRMLMGTDVAVGLCERGSGRLLAFARALTDGIYKALILDVVVAETHHGQGLGRRVLDALFAHEMLRDVEQLELYCLPDLVPYYARWGFTDELGTLRFMRWDRRGSAAAPPGSSPASSTSGS